MNGNYLDLKYFLEIASTGNISRAADRLGVTQPSLSQSVKKLERDLKVQLLIREKRGIHLTKAGLNVAAQAKELLETWDKIKLVAIADNNEIQGFFSIGCHPSVARYALPSVLKKLLSQNDKLQFNLLHDLSRKITENVITRKLDFGIVVNSISHPDLVIRHLGFDSIALWESEKRTSNTLIADFELSQVQFLLHEFSKKGLTFANHISSSSLEVTASLVKCGAGYGLLPCRVSELEGKNSLKKVDPRLPEHKDRISLVYRSDTSRTKAFKFIIETIMTSVSL